jgi:Fic family protein
VGDKRAVGAAELMVDVRRTFALPLSEAKLLDWHRMVMAGNRTVATGRWRAHREPMQVVSGSVGRQTVHFEAPPSERVPAEMARFIGWYNETAPNEANPIQNPIIRSAVAHLYFESVHPFEDGNGRIGRAIAEKALSQGVGRPVVLSLSRAIEADRAGYYTALQTAQRSNEITPWIYWFAQTVLEAQEQAQQQIAFTLRKSQLLDRVRDTLNDRQLKVVSRMLEEGPNGFKAGMSAKKYMSMTAVSKATATRDLQDLVAKGVLTATGDGRSTRYHVVV